MRTLSTRIANAAVAIFLSLLLLPAMYFLDWVIVPKIVARITGAVYADGYIGSVLLHPLFAGLVWDIALSFIADVILMYLALLYPQPYGKIVAAILAAFGLALYFWEVGGVRGMLHSDYGIWYEWISFAQYPVAFYVARHLRGITRGSRDRRTAPSIDQEAGR
jgi:hypothetical protein